MLRRNFKHIARTPVTVFNAALMPVVMMLIFVYVFGNAFNVGGHYIDYATLGLLLLAISYGLPGTAVSVSSDMAKGVINRFKVMDVSRGAVLTGHVVATMLTNAVAIAAVVAVAFALGFRSPASALDWLGALGLDARRRRLGERCFTEATSCLLPDPGRVRVGAIRQAISTPVVLVGHSYGGMVITEAAAGSTDVAALVYVCAFAPAPGESALELSDRFPGGTLGEALTAYPICNGGNELAIRPEVFVSSSPRTCPAPKRP